MSRKLDDFKNLTDWAIRARTHEDHMTLPAQKDAALSELNHLLETNYKRQHIDNWLAGRKAIPKRVFNFWFDLLLEVEHTDTELRSQLRRLFNT